MATDTDTAVQVIAFFEQPGLQEYYDQLWAATDPTRPHGPAKLTGHGRASVSQLLPNIQLARRLLVEVRGGGGVSSCFSASGLARRCMKI